MKKKIQNVTLGLLALLAFGAWSLNAPSYDYNPTPASTQTTEQPFALPSIKSGSLNFSFAPHNSMYMPGKKDTQFVYTRIIADKINLQQNMRIPLNLCVVLDRSGSMAGDKLKYVKMATEFLAKNLLPSDYISLVIYDSEVETLLKPTKVENKDQIINIINKISDRGATNLCGGLTTGYSLIKSNYKSGFVNRVLLLSDGEVNTGIIDPVTINNFARNANIVDGITTSTFGVGIDFNENLMMGIAESGAGNYYYIQNPDQIPDIFKKELNGLQTVVAQNAKIQVTLPSGIKVLKVYGYDNQSSTSDKIEILLRDISSEDEKSFLFSYIIDSSFNGELQFTASYTFDDAINGNQGKQLSQNISIQPVYNSEVLISGINKDIVAQYAIYHSNWIMMEAMRMVDKGKYIEANQILLQNNHIHHTYGYAISGNTLFNAQDSLIKTYQTNVNNYSKMSTSQQKVIQKTNKSEAYKIQKRK